MRKILDFYLLGGPAMHLILLCLGLGVFLAARKWIKLSSAQIYNKSEALLRLQELILTKDIDQAIRFSSSLSGPVAKVVRAGLLRYQGGADREGVEVALESAAMKEIPLFEKSLGHLSALANIATLLGLLGTVSGLIGAFDSVAALSGAEKATQLSMSIAQAMHTTAFGLVAAIPLLACYSFLSGLAESLINDIQEASLMTLDLLGLKREIK